MDDAKFTALVEKWQGYLETVEGVTDEVRDSAGSVARAYAALAKRDGVDISGLLTGNPIADRARLETADLVAEMGETIDWAAFPLAAFEVAKTALSLAVTASALF